MRGWLAVDAVLWLALACYYLAGARKRLQNRRDDRRIREHVRTASPEDLSGWLGAETAVALASSISTGESG